MSYGFVCVSEKENTVKTTDNEDLEVPEMETRVRFNSDRECKQEHSVSF